MRITLAGFTTLLSSIILAIYSLHISSLEALTLSVSLLLLVFMGYRDVISYRDSLRGIEVVRRISREYVEEGDVVEITLEVRNTSDRHIPRIEVEDIAPEPSRPLDEPLLGGSLPPGYVARLSYRLYILSPGRYEFSQISVRVKDPLGFFAEESVVELRSMVVAIPKILALREGLSIASRYPGLWIRGMSLGGLYDLYSFREYQAGDDARKIAWRLYAKSGVLLVREDLSESRAKALVIIDIPESTWHTGKTPNTLAEQLARISRGAIEALIKNYSSVDVVICEKHAPRIIRGLWTGNREKIYTVYSNLKPYSGCETSFVLYNSLKYLEIGAKDLAIVITSPTGLAETDPKTFIETISLVAKKKYIIIYTHEEEEKAGAIGLLEIAIPALKNLGWEIIPVSSR